MAVRVVLTSGERRVLPEADGARARQQVVVTLSAQLVIRAEIVKDGEVVDYVPGAGQAQNGK